MYCPSAAARRSCDGCSAASFHCCTLWPQKTACEDDAPQERDCTYSPALRTLLDLIAPPPPAGARHALPGRTNWAPWQWMDCFLTSLVAPSLRMPKYSLTPSRHRPALLLLAFPPMPRTPLIPRCPPLGHRDRQSWLSSVGGERASSPLLLQLSRKHRQHLPNSHLETSLRAEERPCLGRQR